MKQIKHIKQISLVYTQEYDYIIEWDSEGHILYQRIANCKRYRNIEE